MNIIVNAISIRDGGSLVVLDQLLSAMIASRPKWCWHIAINEPARDRLPAFPNTTFHVYPHEKWDNWKVRLWYEFDLPNLIDLVDGNAIFSQTNYLPYRKLPCPSLLLVQNAGHFSALFTRLVYAHSHRLMQKIAWRLKTQWVYNSVRRADQVTVQTRALARKIQEATKIPPNRITVIPHGPGLAAGFSGSRTRCQSAREFRIGYISQHGVQKNFAVVFRAVARLRAKGFNTVLVLTLDEALAKNQAILSQAQGLDVLSLIENHGDLPPPGVNALYDSIDAFVFPSLCESLGLPMLEAMAHGLPLLISMTESNTEIAGAAGLGFLPDDDLALSRWLRRLAEEPSFYAEQSLASSKRAAEFDWQVAGRETCDLLEDIGTFTR